MYHIGEFAQRVALSIDTLRYYEKLGLLQPKRDNHQQRLYSDQDLTWLAFIKRLKQIGMPMRDIQTYAKLRAQGDTTITARMTLLHHQTERLLIARAEVDAQLKFLDRKLTIYQDRLRELTKF
ncbi:MerR family transcriptional regulator [Lactiplantibacillus daowaiensis]|uniref:MerR family transcriptional regulator n=1 Tax=Lactiplantibacillus daowaiensis TaxID=2559918 RepID=A0ABW1S2Y1_9LACO